MPRREGCTFCRDTYIWGHAGEQQEHRSFRQEPCPLHLLCHLLSFTCSVSITKLSPALCLTPLAPLKELLFANLIKTLVCCLPGHSCACSRAALHGATKRAEKLAQGIAVLPNESGSPVTIFRCRIRLARIRASSCNSVSVVDPPLCIKRSLCSILGCGRQHRRCISPSNLMLRLHQPSTIFRLEPQDGWWFLLSRPLGVKITHQA